MPNKVNGSGQHWKAGQLSRSERIERLLEQYQAIKVGLDEHINSISGVIPGPSEVMMRASLKPVEGMLDGLVCAWVSIKHLEGPPVELGNDTAAIWIPQALINP